MRGRFVTEGPAARLGAAIMPVPARQGMGYQSWGPVSGSPGTQRIAAPAPVPGIDRELTATAIQGVGPGGMGRPSSDYNYWTPGVYYQPAPASKFGGALESDNQLPVPAKLPSGRSIGFVATGNRNVFVAARRSRFTGQRQVAWPFTASRFDRQA